MRRGRADRRAVAAGECADSCDGPTTDEQWLRGLIALGLNCEMHTLVIHGSTLAEGECRLEGEVGTAITTLENKA